jgi:septal ring factor EnvC (AmiA/AmiB activator)
MRRTTLVAVAVLAVVVASPAAGDVYGRKHSVDARLSALHARIAEAQRKAQALSAQIDSVSSRIQRLEGRVGDVSARLTTLESDLALHQRKLDRLTALFRLETKRYGWMDGYGNLVFIDHGRGISTGYAHQSSIAVSNGQTVTQGQVIGYVGCTGHCFGPHLHFEVRVNGTPVDPLGYL